jgi:putative addiction module antidote
MAYKVKVTTVGNSTGIVLPKELLMKLKIEKGDTLYVTETPDGVQLTPYQEEFARTMEVAEDIMRRYRDTLRQLAQ